MFARKLVPAALATCALALMAPALAGTPGQPRRQAADATSRTADGGEHRPRHTSDGVPGPIALQIPEALRTTTSTGDPVTWEVAPGVTYARWDQRDARGPIRAHLLTVDPRQPGLRLDYAARGAVRKTGPVSQILAKHAAIAGVNGDFYDIGDTGAPLGLGRDRQRGLLHARQAGWNSSFYLDAQGVPEIGTLAMLAQITQHPELTITNLNSSFVRPGGIGVYTPAWGRTAGYRVTDGQKRRVRMVVIRDGRVRASTRRLSKDDRISGLVLVGRGDGARKLRRLRVGSRATVQWRLDQQPQMAITGNRFLVHDGLIKVVDDREQHPRTAIGIDEDTGEVLVLVVDGRQSFSRGYTMVELADLMIDLGADEALNLDGGGSSTMVARRPSGKVGVVNSPSDGYQRSVANALEITYRRPG